MKMLCLLAAALFFSAAHVPSLVNSPIQGDYVEARTASVFAGACHYNGELVTTGQEAVMAWDVKSGTFEGIDLSGLKAVAAVHSQENLADAAARKSELLIDSAATPQQAAAFAKAVQGTFSKTLGTVVTVTRGPILFRHDSSGYQVQAAGFAAMSVQPMPDRACCKQPNLVWYSPLVPLQDRRVGFTSDAAYTAATLGDAWERANENSAFYGMFSF